jgi:hypothetical protein
MDGRNKTAVATGNKNFSLLLEISHNIKDSKNTEKIIINTIPIASVGPAVNGNRKNITRIRPKIISSFRYLFIIKPLG